MATTIGYAALDVIPSLQNVRQNIERQAAGPMAQAGRTTGRRFGDAAGREAGSEFRGRFTGMLRGLAGLGAGVGIVSLFRSTISEASEAEQAIGGVSAVFGQYAEQVQRESANASESLGLSATAYQQLVTVSGALLKNKGLTDFADQARILVEIGADLSAAYGGDTLQAVEALNAAMRGESDPIERYAISLNETAVNAELAATGQDKLTGAALEQAKTQARLNLILKQSSDVRGQFARESDTLAGQQQRLTAEWADMRRELGEELLPAAAGFVSFLRTDGLPAFSATADAVTGLTGALGDIPGPVWGAVAAFTALKAASALGAGALGTRSIAGASSAMESLRIRTMLATDAYRAARGGTLELQGAYGRLTPATGRLTSTMRGLSTAAAGVGTSLRRGVGGLVGFLGGPWGIAFAAGTAVLTKWYMEQKEAEARVQALTDSLDQQTGSITDQTRALIFDTLQKEGAIDVARQFGISLGTVRSAAEGNESALRSVNAQIDDYISRQPKVTAGSTGAAQGMQNALDAADKLRGALGGQNDELARSQQELRSQAEFMGESKTATEETAGATRNYRSDLDKATGALRRLINAEKERALQAVQNRRDQIALIQTLQSAQREARQGEETLDRQKKAGQENMLALLDLADQWNNSSKKVRNARGAYEEIRQKFIEVADQMNGPNGTRKDAEKLAESLLTLPKDVPLRFRSEGFRERMEEIRALKEAARDLEVQLNFQGLVKAAGVGATGGSTVSPSGKQTTVNVNVDKLVANDTNDFLQKAQQKSIGGF